MKMVSRVPAIGLAMAGFIGSSTAQAAFGDIDTSFGSAGVTTVDVSDGGNDWVSTVFVDGEDRIYAFAGYNKVVGETLEVGTRMMRFTKDGVLDETFGTGGTLDLGPLSGPFAVDDEGRFLVATSKDVDEDLLLARFTADGTPDESFGTNGVATLVVDEPDYIYGIGAVLVRPDGTIGVGATRWSSTVHNKCTFLARFTDGGEPDASFGTGGGAMACTDSSWQHEVYAIANGPDGRTLTGGWRGLSFGRSPMTSLASESGTWHYKAAFLGEQDGQSGQEVVALHYGANRVGALAIALTNGEPSTLVAFGGTTLDLATGEFGSVTRRKVTITPPANWLYQASWGVQSNGKVIMAGRVDAGEHSDAALVRYRGTPELALNPPASGGGGGGGAIPPALLGFLAALALARRRP